MPYKYQRKIIKVKKRIVNKSNCCKADWVLESALPKYSEEYHAFEYSVYSSCYKCKKQCSILF
jgi:hypothetical protein